MEKILLMDERRYIGDVDGVCVLRYDNEAGKGDHRHLGKTEMQYAFTTIEQLYADFMSDVSSWRAK